MHKGTGIFDAIMREGEEESHMSNIETPHTLGRSISIDEDSVEALRPLPP
jgi:hypothetical protein